MPPTPARHQVIESLSVSGGIHFRDVTFSFHDLLNILIGERGTGKSGVVHLVRFAMGAPIPESYAEEFDEYIEGTLGTGTATVVVRTEHGVRYTSSRTYGSDPVVRDESGRVVDVSLVGELFQIQAYAQNELEGIARNPASQLALMDSFDPTEIRAIDDAIEQTERRLLENAARLRRIKAEIAEDAAREGELPAVVEALKGVDLGGVSESSPEARKERERAYEAKVARGRERAAMATLAGDLEGVRSTLDAFARDALQKLARAIEVDLERGPHAEVFRRAHAAMQRVSGALEGGAGRLHAEIAAAEKATAEEGRALAADHAKEEEAYQALVVRDDADRARSVESERLHRRFAELSSLAKRLGDRRREEGAAKGEQTALLAERDRLLEEKAERRDRVCASWTAALKDEVRAKIAHGGNSEPFFDALTKALRGSNIRETTIRTIAKRIRPRDLIALVENDEIEPLVAIDAMQSEREERARKILSYLRENERMDEILLARCEDAPLIELKVGKRWRRSKPLSTGQRCTCILLILLLRSKAPLLVDQAEDSLDNLFICNVLVDRLDETKETRQIVVTTLNPNPPALADADRIFVLDVDEEEGNGLLVGTGTFAEVKPHVERLEGGRKAFRRRGERYGVISREEDDAGEAAEDE